MRRRHRRLSVSPELDITAFLNLMIVLVPVLLLGMVFSQVRMIELNFPGMDAGETPAPEEFRLVVTLIPEGIEIADSDRGLIRVLPAEEAVQDFEGLRQVLRQIKNRVPEKTDVVLEVGPDIDYQTLITAMDTVRSYPAVVAASVVEGELFPDVSLKDAPADRKLAANARLESGEDA
ncbi:biopolymer transporter ExbD [Marinobacter adhaerens]|jgi:biopolymer transport protein ExbD|uniref:Biopolymer transporter ExbD n=2 Tax=Marinobacter adhaerens TaxID=1033846 RepID=A0ABX8ID09_9GAMM|nr:biopolymer transporter ExbD [Marinobacter adhaerens]MBW4978423.1 biopolymer transporter ExbD [Marinobacter adhaerens]QWV11697.1 biopolymer transporter ExbD [Marinobacter adhaerens]